MSQDNIAALRPIYAAWEGGDFSSAAWAHPDIEVSVADGFEADSNTGRAGLTEWWHGWLRTWAEYRVEVEEYRALDDERVLVLMLHCGRGKASGLDVEGTGAKSAGANLLHLRDGKVSRLVLYWDRERALAALGLSD